MELIEKEVSKNTLIITVNGELITHEEVEKFRRVLTSREHRNMVINLKKVSFLCSLAIGMMIMGYKQSSSRQGSFILCHAPKEAEDSLYDMGLLDLLTFAKDEAEALVMLEEK
ncbi:MAG: STAS domain-containing protein [SAR324 cluster bacterium]|nr:STAS domain-containing protein [SAR324 cluster bacterium]